MCVYHAYCYFSLISLQLLFSFSEPLLSFNDKLITVFAFFFDSFHESQRFDRKIRLNLSFFLTNLAHIYVEKFINHLAAPRVLPTFRVVY